MGGLLGGGGAQGARTSVRARCTRCKDAHLVGAADPDPPGPPLRQTTVRCDAAAVAPFSSLSRCPDPLWFRSNGPRPIPDNLAMIAIRSYLHGIIYCR
jgi:hypothetical protein